MTTNRVALVFWGRKGGGRVLIDQLAMAGNRLGADVHVSLRPSLKGEQIGVFSVSSWLRARKKVVSNCKELGIHTVIFVMASPWDLFLDQKLKKNGMKVLRIIHDAEPHPGESFPPVFWVTELVRNADKIVVFSNYVAGKLLAKSPEISPKLEIGKLPPPVLQIVRQQPASESDSILLFAGRGKKYKGLELLQKAWPLIGSSKDKLIIAGSNHKKIEFDSRTEFSIKWLSDLELEELVRMSRLVLLPYIEASQSGLIPFAHSLGKPVVVTPVGGLAEQVIEGENGIVAKSTSPEAFAEAVNKALSINWNIEPISEVFLQA